jgi:hypothetical protein
MERNVCVTLLPWAYLSLPEPTKSTGQQQSSQTAGGQVNRGFFSQEQLHCRPSTAPVYMDSLLSGLSPSHIKAW